MQPYAKVEELPHGFAPVLKVKSKGRVDLGVYSTARKAAVAHDVARLVCLHEKRPETDLRLDTGLMHPVEGYLVDPTFMQLIDNNQPFETVCELLKSGAIIDDFLCAQDRQTRSNTSGERPAAARRQQQQQHAQPQRSGGGNAREGAAPTPPPPRMCAAQAVAVGESPAATQQDAAHAKQPHLQPQCKSSADTQQALPPASPFDSATLEGGGAAAHAPAPAAPAVLPCANSIPSAATAATAAGAADDAPGSASPAKKKAMRWLEWPTKGGGQFVSCISERALKSSMTLPVKMKRELFQVTQSPAPIAAYDLQPGSSQRWNWEVRDYVKDERRVTSIHNLGNFFKHYEAVSGDVLVVVASAPGAVKATVWKGGSQDAIAFKAFQDRQAEKQSRQAAGGGSGGGSRKRAGEGPLDKQVAKVAKTSAGNAHPAPARGGGAPPSFSPDGSRPMSKSGSGPQLLHQQSSVQQKVEGQQQQQQGPPAQQQQQQQQRQQQASGGAAVAAMAAQHHDAKTSTGQRPQQHGAARAPPRMPAQQPRQAGAPRAEALLALADSGIDPSHPSVDETHTLSPTGQVAQSPYRHQPLMPVVSTAVPIKQEHQDHQGSPPPRQQEQQGQAGAGEAANGGGDGAGAFAAPAAAAGARAATGEAGGGGTHSPARLSCADASQLLGQQAGADTGHGLQQQQQQQVLSQPAASGAGAVGMQQDLPDPLELANDEAGVYVAMSRLLSLVASSGRVPSDAVSGYRRSFMRLDPHGKRWFAYDSLKQMVDAAEWSDVHAWLQCK